MPLWGKVRIANGGDAIRCQVAQSSKRQERDSSYVRVSVSIYSFLKYFIPNKCSNYEILVDRNAARRNAPEDLQRQVCYGRLESILECVVSASRRLGTTRDTRYLLVLVTRCKTGGGDASHSLVTYTETETSSVIDLSCVGAVVGRMRVGQANSRWAILDRSGDLARTIFTDGDDEGFNPQSED